MTTYLEMMDKRQEMVKKRQVLMETAARRREQIIDRETLRVGAAHLPEVHRIAPVHLRGINKI